MSHNYKAQGLKFFNSQNVKKHEAWADAAIEYYNAQSGKKKRNFADAMEAFYAAVIAGTIAPPVSPTPTQKLVSNGESIPVRNASGTVSTSGPATISASSFSYVTLPGTQALVGNTTTTNVPITFTTARTAGQQATVLATYTVAGGVITAITIA